ncbi:MAG TPA: phosphoglucosamine mutase [Clostridiales bacterium]|nr:phosphoglucosamine mutase [Clostridiales bacterium]
MGKYFGTDGIRGVVNDGLDAEISFKVGQAAAMVLSENKGGRPLFTIGKDTRISGDMLEAALVAGLCSAGADVMLLGVVPTPAVAFITMDVGADAGIVISASHNPYEHNGIKIFNSEGFKLSDELERKIEELIDAPERVIRRSDGDIGRVVKKNSDFLERYIDHVVRAAEGGMGKMRVMIDCSNGAACKTAKSIFSRFPLELEFINDNPNGININEKCGSTHPELLAKLVTAGGFDLGLAFDGDADRCIAVDEKGQIVDGDKIMAICGVAMKDRGKLAKDCIVATVMSNLGFHEYAANRGIKLRYTPIGDRYVLEQMLECGYNLGGEQSGHIIFLDDSTTGDGQLSAVKFLSVVSRSGRKVSELAAEIPTYPQILKNVPVKGGNEIKNAIMADIRLKELIAREEERLGGRGRILVRPSGTEALIRVMVEAEHEDTAVECSENLSKMINCYAEEKFL